MQQKSSRGVQQEDVFAAADALLAQRLRPTIERVRQHLGRGSPNTVSPMLEAWFATLGPRLGVVAGNANSSALPAPVRQAAEGLWLAAQEAAREAAEQALFLDRQQLDAERAALQEMRLDLTRREQALHERQRAMDDTLSLTRGQLAEMTARLADAHATSSRKDREIDQLRAGQAAAEQELAATRRKHEAECRDLAVERQQALDRAAATERRLLQEVDRARQESKQLKAAALEAERSAENRQHELAAALRTLEEKLHQTQGESDLLRQAAAAAEQRSAELRSLLDREHAATAAALTQLRHAALPGARPKPSRRLRK